MSDESEPSAREPSDSDTESRPHYHVFLSHNSADKSAVEPLALMLKQKGLNPFLDKWNLVPGEPIEDALVDALENSDSAVIFVGPEGDGPWQSEEMRDILKRAVKSHNEFRAIPVLLPGASAEALEKSFLGSRLWIEFKDVDDNDALLRMAKAIQGEAYGDETFNLPDEPAPYRGLERFERIENPEEDFFFGRDDEIRALVERLVKERFVAVVGASGSGKSSLIRAGLTKQLAEEIHPGIRRWQTLTVEPGSAPFRSLAVQVAVAAGIPIGERESWIEDRVQKWSFAPDGVRTSIETLFADAKDPLLVFIDQFEELFTHRKEDAESERLARNFVANLADIWKNGGNRVRVVVALRADFVERCLEIGPLKELLQDRTMLVGEVGDDALREIVKEPAARVGAFLEKGLMERILTEVRSQSGSLPLLQQALHELWKHRKGAWLTHEAFDASGGVARALNDQAQAAYKALDDEQKKIADGLFPRLITLGEGVSDTRRRVRRKELYPEWVDPVAVNEVIDKLSGKEARILVTTREGGDSEDLAVGEDFVEFTHEALLGNWGHLVALLDSERESIRKHRNLTTTAEEWASKPEDDRHKFLLRAGQLVIAEQWTTQEGGYARLNQLEREFFDESIRERTAEEVHKAKIARRLKLLSIGATAAAVVAILLSGYAIVQKGEAEFQKDTAESARSQAETNRGMARELMSNLVPELTSTTDSDKKNLAKSAVTYFENFASKHNDDKKPPSPLYADAKYVIGGIHYDTKDFENAKEALDIARNRQYQALEKSALQQKLPLVNDVEDLPITPRDEALAKDLSDTLNALGHVYRDWGHNLKPTDKDRDKYYNTAKDRYTEAAAIREKLAEIQPKQIEYGLLHASAEMNIGLVEKNLGNVEEARKKFAEAHNIRAGLPTALLNETDMSAIDQHIALGYLNLAVMLYEKPGKATDPPPSPEVPQTPPENPETIVSKAITRYDKVIKRYDKIINSGERTEEDFVVRAELANCYALRGHLRKRTRTGLAIDDYNQAKEIYEVLIDRRPWIPKYRKLLSDLGLVFNHGGDPKLAIEWTAPNIVKAHAFLKSIKDFNALELEKEPENEDFLRHFATLSFGRARLLFDSKRWDDGRDELEADAQRLSKLRERIPADSWARYLANKYLAEILHMTAEADIGSNDLKAAKTAKDEALKLREGLVAFRKSTSDVDRSNKERSEEIADYHRNYWSWSDAYPRPFFTINDWDSASGLLQADKIYLDELLNQLPKGSSDRKTVELRLGQLQGLLGYVETYGKARSKKGNAASDAAAKEVADKDGAAKEDAAKEDAEKDAQVEKSAVGDKDE